MQLSSPYCDACWSARFLAARWLISYASARAPTLSFLWKGSDTLLIKNRRINCEALRDAHMSGDDLAEILRQQGAADQQESRKPWKGVMVARRRRVYLARLPVPFSRCASISAPNRMTMVEIQIQTMNPMMAPSDP